MPKIQLITIGKCKHNAYRMLEEEYSQRLKHYTSFEIIYLNDSKQKSIALKNEEESKNILSKIHPAAFVVLLDERGAPHTTQQMAQLIQKWDNNAIKQVVFIVGGAFGVNDSIKNKADLSLSLSSFTLPHEMARVVLVEQIYRAYTVLRGEKYHH
jgi:23S rRNA (pseudouridine1915-N3)-methyltransferase